MSRDATAPYRFGDLLALARESWVSQMASGLAALGYDGYRRTDAAVMRLLQRGPLPIGRLGQALGVTRQAARKVADGLCRRGLAATARDDRDWRQLNVVLTAEGEAYARAVTTVIDGLNHDLCQRVDLADLAAAGTVLRAVLADDLPRPLAGYLPTPPPVPPGTGIAEPRH